jgi:hypothetical protein
MAMREPRAVNHARDVRRIDGKGVTGGAAAGRRRDRSQARRISAEGDAYGYLESPPLTPISWLISERSFYIVSFAKCPAPGLRIAAMIAPEAFRDRSISALHATGWMAVPVMARLIHSGGLARRAGVSERQ